MGKRKPQRRTPKPGSQRIYELEVSILDGRMTERFDKANPVISRTIQIRGDQKLADLHEAIFEAFGRWDDHLYEFQVGGKRRMDPKARRYSLPSMYNDPFDDQKPAGVVTKTTIDSLGLAQGECFAYWFDFGDDWWHAIKVAAIHDGPGSGEYPRVTAQVGANPPQYPNWDDEDDE